MSQFTIPVLLIATLAFTLWRFVIYGQRRLPKGTKRPPIVGHFFSLPKTHMWLQFKQWSDQFGPVMRMNVAGTEHYILSTEKVASDLLVKKGSIYSSRPQIPTNSHLLSGDLRPLFLPYNDLWRNGRKFMHHVASNNAASSYQPNQAQESIRMLRDLLREPAKYEHWFYRYSAGVMIRLSFGKAIQTGDEEILHQIESVIDGVKVAEKPHLVNLFPALQNLPKAIAPFRRKFDKLHQKELGLFRQFLSDARADLERGEARKSWEHDMIQLQHKFNLTDDQGAYVVGTLFEAGTHTTAIAMETWVLAMVHHPEWLRRIQAEVDSICGSDRLPTLEDMPHLPTVRAVLKESMRWRPVFPGGIPHSTTKDDVYDGFFIPAGSVIHANTWAIHSDPELFPDPETFDPNRWLDPKFPTYREPLTTFPNMHNFSAFGYGRRLCPGQYIAENSLNLLTARMAWSFDIGKARGSDGEEITPSIHDFTGHTIISQPNPFPFDLKARNQGRADIIETEFGLGEANDPLQKLTD